MVNLSSANIVSIMININPALEETRSIGNLLILAGIILFVFSLNRISRNRFKK